MRLDQARANIHEYAEIMAVVAIHEAIAKCGKAAEYSNRSFGQLIRQHEARMARIIGQGGEA